MKSIDTEEFFKKVAVNSEIADIKLIKDVFYGMIRTISRELKSNQRVKLPDWGEFVLKIYKERRSPDVNDGVIRVIPAQAMVKFVPDYKVKKYFYAFGKEGL